MGLENDLYDTRRYGGSALQGVRATKEILPSIDSIYSRLPQAFSPRVRGCWRPKEGSGRSRPRSWKGSS